MLALIGNEIHGECNKEHETWRTEKNFFEKDRSLDREKIESICPADGKCPSKEIMEISCPRYRC